MGKRKGRGKAQASKAAKEKGEKEGTGAAVAEAPRVAEKREKRETLEGEQREKGEKRESREKRENSTAVERETERAKEREKVTAEKESEGVTEGREGESAVGLVARVARELEDLTRLEETLRAQVSCLRRDVAKGRAQRDAGLERYNELLKAQAPPNLPAQAALVRAQAAQEAEGSPALSCCIAVAVMLVAAVFPFFLVPLLIVRQSVEPSASTVEYVMQRLFEPAVAFGS